MKRLIKFLSILVGVLVIAAAGFIWFGLHKMKMFPEIDMAVETTGADTGELVGHIDRIVSFGMRNPGTEGDLNTRKYILERFAEYGLETQKPDSFAIKMFEPRSWQLSLKDAGSGKSITVPCAYMPFSASTESSGLTAPLIYVADEENIKDLDLKGKIAAYEMQFRPKGLKTYSKILYMYDPDDTLDSSARVVRARLEYEYKMYEKLKAAGAVGMIGLLSGLQWDSDRYYPQMSFGLEKAFPACGSGRASVIGYVSGR